MTNHFRQNFVTQKAEVHLPDVPVTGTIPSWLNGTLIRCGPGQFEQAHASYKHWFDGLSMPHRYTFKNGKLSFQNRFLHSEAYIKDSATGVLNYRGVFVDPKRTVWDKIKALFINDVTDNCNIQTVDDQGTIVIMTELPHMYQLDPISLQTMAKYEYDHKINATMQTAHPHIDPNKGNLIVNYMLKISLFNYYEVFNVHGRAYERVSRVPVTSPSYMHSFALTENYVILAEQPLKLPPYGRGIMGLAFGNKPFMENFVWHGNHPTIFQVIDRNSGAVVTQAESDAFFVFHQLNAYEQNGEIIMDLAAYPDATVLPDFFLDRLRSETNIPHTPAQARRYRIPLGKPSSRIEFEPLADINMELPRINYGYNTRPYRYAYGTSLHQNLPDFPNQLVKIDVTSGETAVWHQPLQYPSEPVFVPNPNATVEDDGVVLANVYDANTNSSYLLVLDGQSFTQMARGDLNFHIPFDYHGWFYPGVV
jgi:carotenoid cleavage dioxygenase-like enzyme